MHSPVTTEANAGTAAGIVDPSQVRLRSTRDALLTALIVLAVACSSVALLYYTARSAYVATVHEDLVQLARAAASVVDGDLHRTFVSPEQESTRAYETAVMPLRRILQSVRGIRYLYTVVLVNQQPHFVLDATPPGDADRDGVEDHSAVLEIYEKPDVEMLVALHQRQATVMEEPEADKWGPVLSAYAPFTDSSRQFVGVVGVDITAERYAERLAAMRAAALTAFVFAGLLSTLVGMQLFRIRCRSYAHAWQRELDRIAIQEALSRFESMLENAPAVAIQGFDRRGIIKHWNRASTNLYGYASADAVGRPIQDLLLTLEDAESFRRDVEELWTTGRPTPPREWSIQTHDGRLRWVYSSMFPVFVHGQVVEAFCMDVDISERRQFEERMSAHTRALEDANEALQASSEAAQQATRAKSEFLANMSHEIRTPMTAILGFAEILLGEEGLENSPPQRIEALRIIQRNGRHLLQIINDILDLSKIEAGKLATHRVPCSPIEIVADATRLVRLQAEQKGLALVVEWPAPVPEVIHTDPLRLRQILINLIGNAVKFTLSGSVHIVTRLVSDGAGPPYLKFDIIDTGIGMSPEQLSVLFSPFSQADGSVTRKFGGTGLGLAISRRLAYLLGGDVSVYSAPGRGSTVSVTVDSGPLDGVRMVGAAHGQLGDEAREVTVPSQPLPRLCGASCWPKTDRTTSV